uniref:Delta(24)-sterol reductase n=1 Tax=Parastrongyloides trichosuri TaxID=131310 RepID=A0A0N4ZQP5_PARTI
MPFLWIIDITGRKYRLLRGKFLYKIQYHKKFHENNINKLRLEINDSFKKGIEPKLNGRKYMNGILNFNETEKTLTVEPLVTINELIEFLDKTNFMIPCMPRDTNTTISEMIEYGCIGSDSKRYGLFHHTCLEYEVINDDGKILVASKLQKNSKESHNALFYGIPLSGQSLCVLLSVKFKLIEKSNIIKITYFPVEKNDVLDELKKICSNGIDKRYLDILNVDNQIFIFCVGELVKDNNNKIIINDSWRDNYYECYRKKKEIMKYMTLKGYMYRDEEKINERSGLRKTISKTFFNVKQINNTYLFPLKHTTLMLDEMTKLKLNPKWLTLVNIPSLPGLLRQREGKNCYFVAVNVFDEINSFELKSFREGLMNFEKMFIEKNGVGLINNHTTLSQKTFWLMYDSSFYQWLRARYVNNFIRKDVYECQVIKNRLD